MKDWKQACIFAMLVSAFSWPVHASDTSPAIREVTAWAPALTTPARFNNQTLRMTAHLSIGGRSLRIRLSNRYGFAPLHIGAAVVALRASGGEMQAGTSHRVTLGGKRDFFIAPGAETTSDPIEGLDVPTGTDLLVSLYLPDPTPIADYHPMAYETLYVSLPGDHTGDVDTRSFPQIGNRSSFHFVTGITVETPRALGTIVAFGDSITDGADTTVGANHRWPDFLAQRLAMDKTGIHYGVVNAGIGSNRMLVDHPGAGGEAAIKRFGHDALGQANVRAVIVLEGINDIGSLKFDGTGDTTSAEIIEGYRKLIAMAHARGVKILGATITPASPRPTFTPERERTRNEVNAWIRNSGEFDSVFDFDAALRDPADPTRIIAAYDSGDHLHPNDAGMRAIAESIDLRTLLRVAGSARPIAPRNAEWNFKP